MVMGQPYQQGQQWSPGAPTERPRRSRTGMWIAVVCAVLVVVVGVVAVLGGVLYLVSRDGGGGAGGGDPTDDAAVATYEGDYFTFDYPEGWVDLSDAEGFVGAGGLVEVADEEPGEELGDVPPNDLRVYMYSTTYGAQTECRAQAVWSGFNWDDAGDPQEQDPTTIGGEEMFVQRVTGTHQGQDAVSEMYCMDLGSNVVQIVAEHHGGAELGPELTAILDSWVWKE